MDCRLSTQTSNPSSSLSKSKIFLSLPILHGISCNLQSSLPPNETGTPYTIPTVKLPDNTWIMDSRKIVDHIEKSHPEPSMHLESPYLAKLEDLLPNVFQYMRAICYARVPVNLLNDVSIDYWYTTRAERIGMSVQDFEKNHGGETAYSSAEPYLQQVTALLRENSDGPFFMGKTVSYADFVWVSALVFFKRVDETVYQEVLKRTGDESIHVKLLEACQPWLKRHDH